MPNIIKIKRSTTADAPASLSQGELAYSERSDTLFIGVVNGGTPGVDAIGGEGHYLTKTTNQGTLANPLTGVKYFSIDSIKITGGADGKFIKTTGDGDLAWADTSVDAYSRIQGSAPGSIVNASGETTLRFETNNNSISFTVAEGIIYDSVTLNVSDATTSTKGIVELTNTIDNTENKAATPKSVNTVKATADNALSRDGGTMSGFIRLHADPSDPMDAATRKYVDSVATGLDVKASVRVATTGALPGVTYANGTDGVGATITGPIGTALGAIDGVTLVKDDRILVKNQGSGTPPSSVQNGIYVVDKLTAPYILVRATDADSDSEVTPGMFVFVEEGTRNADNGFVLSTNGDIDIGVDELAFTQFSGAGKITPGTGLDKDGDTLNITTVPPANGGTGVTTYAVGDILYADGVVPGDTTLAKLAIGASGRVLSSNGTNPAWTKVSLSSAETVAGVLGAANGGTGVDSLSSNMGTFLKTANATNFGNLFATSDKTGTGNVVFATSPTLTTPVIGTATGTSLTTTGSLTTRAATTTDAVIIASRPSVGSNTRSVTITTPSTALTANRTLTLADGNTELQAGTMATTEGKLNQFASTPSNSLAEVISDATGTGLLVFNTSPKFKTSVDADTESFQVFNDTATTINAFGAGTTINIGATTGSTSIKNKVQLANPVAARASINFGTGAIDPTTRVSGDVWLNSGTIKLQVGAGVNDFVSLLDDNDVIDGGSFS